MDMEGVVATAVKINVTSLSSMTLMQISLSKFRKENDYLIA
jgi:hypothetical protein